MRKKTLINKQILDKILEVSGLEEKKLVSEAQQVLYLA